MILKLIAIGLPLWIAKEMIGALLRQHATSVVPDYAARIATAAAKILPSELSADYLDDWLAELGALEQKPLNALRYARGLPRAARHIAILAGASAPIRRRRVVAERATDITGSALLLLVVAPFICIVALTLRLEGVAPILFALPRVGRRATVIPVYRFNTRAQQGDGRLRRTRAGAVLERHSLETLPMLINVLRGELSFIGPPAMRPGATLHNLTLQPPRALDVRPGMVSWELLASGGDVDLSPDEAQLRDLDRGLRSDLAMFASVLRTGWRPPRGSA